MFWMCEGGKPCIGVQCAGCVYNNYAEYIDIGEMPVIDKGHKEIEVS